MKRIQRKRTRGWRMPSNTVYVGRPSKWGNSHKITDMRPQNEDLARELAIAAYEVDLRRKLTENPHFLDELKGKDLACWCPLDKACHADVLLKLLEAEKP